MHATRYFADFLSQDDLDAEIGNLPPMPALLYRFGQTVQATWDALPAGQIVTIRAVFPVGGPGHWRLTTADADGRLICEANQTKFRALPADMMTDLMECRTPWQQEIAAWEGRNLRNGRYVGRALPGYPYAPGEYVPVDARHSAMVDHRWAMARQAARA